VIYFMLCTRNRHVFYKIWESTSPNVLSFLCPHTLSNWITGSTFHTFTNYVLFYRCAV